MSLDDKTVAFYELDDSQPVVGWLVCVKGAYYGRSFTLITGKNDIGRLPDNEVSLPNDTSISREKHAVITYDPVKKDFYLQSGSESGMTYHNGELVMNFSQLSPYDEVTLGKANFVFVPLIGKTFKWDEFSEEE